MERYNIKYIDGQNGFALIGGGTTFALSVNAVIKPIGRIKECSDGLSVVGGF